MEKHAGTILLSPRITEKGAHLSEKGVYVFNVAKDASKNDVSRAVQQVFKVIPRKVTMVRVPSKQVITRGTNRKGTTASGKKAYVFLKKGETIEIA